MSTEPEGIPRRCLPPAAGLGLKPEHFADILERRPAVGFFEVHAENYMGEGGPLHRSLQAIRERYPISLHGVALSIGGPDCLDRAHLARLKALIDRYQPESFSEHLAWSTHEAAFLNDLLPLPYTQETLRLVCDHVDETQAVLGRRLLLENPATYLVFEESTIAETAFLAEVARRTGCGLLLDVSNVVVSSVNHGVDPQLYIAAFPLESVGEIHLAGFEEALDDDGARLLIDTHGGPVSGEALQLYEDVLDRTGAVPTLLERDNDVPPLATLLREMAPIEAMLRRQSRPGARAEAAA